MQFHRWLFTLAIMGTLNLGNLASADDEPDKAVAVKLPKAVKKSIKTSYPGAKILASAEEKDDEGETIYEVELLVKGKRVDLLIDEEGEIEEAEVEIEPSDLPQAVTRALAKAYPKAKIDKAEEVTTEDDKVLYEIILIKKGQEPIEVVVVPNGKILETEKDEKDEDDKPKVKKKSKEIEEDDDKPKAKKKSKETEEDEDDDKPKAKKSSKENDKDEDDDKPKAKKKSKEMEEDEDKDEDDDKLSGKMKPKGEQEEDEDEDNDDRL